MGVFVVWLISLLNNEALKCNLTLVCGGFCHLFVSAECGCPLHVYGGRIPQTPHMSCIKVYRACRWMGLMENMAQGNAWISGLKCTIDLSSKADNWCLVHSRAFFFPRKCKVCCQSGLWQMELSSPLQYQTTMLSPPVCCGQPVCAMAHLLWLLFTHWNVLSRLIKRDSMLL